MNLLLSRHVPAALLAVATTLALAAVALAGAPTHARAQTAGGALVALGKTALGSILVDGRGRTLYAFERDRNGVSMCDGACAAYWPPLTGQGLPRAGHGVHRSLLRLTRRTGGAQQVTYAGQPLYTFVGDERAGETAGEGLDDFGAEWYAVAAGGGKVEHERATGSSASSADTGSGGRGTSSGGGW
jgi:predicted lipoprotein with Yx(FWY)xxD motif